MAGITTSTEVAQYFQLQAHVFSVLKNSQT